jgi:glycine/sarcosine N-methyltransferase
MTFYNQFSRYYDYIFPAGKNQINFIEKYFNKGDKILDMACATGEYTLALNDLGYETIGVDLDEAMIDMARDKAAKRNGQGKFVSGNMLESDKLFNNKFKGLICIGNSLVHLKNKSEINLSLEGFYNCLEDKGVMILQNINYDRVVDLDVKELPTIENNEVGIKFIRKYDYDKENNSVWFNTTLILPDESTYHHSTPLYPLRRKELQEILEEVGFKTLGFYGSFNSEDTYKNDSYGLVVVAQK